MIKKRIKSAVPVYGAAAVWLLLGLICPKMLLKMWFLLLSAVLSAGAYFGLSKVFPGRETEVRSAANSGSREIDTMIEAGRAQLDSLASSNAGIPDEEITRQLDRMVKSGEEIFNVLEKNVKKAPAVRKFMNYYLPTAEKLVSTYEMMLNSEAKSDNMSHAMQSVENSLKMIADAFDKQLDNLYKDRALDIDTDIDVLETLMAADGLVKEKRTAAPEPEEEGQTLTLGE